MDRIVPRGLPFFVNYSMRSNSRLSGLLFILLCLLGLIAFRVASDSLPSIGLKYSHRGERVFQDAHGRERIFHGTNVVVKGPPWVPDTTSFSTDISLSAEDLDLMQTLGLNVIRLGTMWAGIEPQKGVYNETMLKILSDIVEMAAQRGIYVLLDMHQDVLNEKFCGEGFPDWATVDDGLKNYFGKFPMPIHAPYTDTDRHGYPTREDCAQHPWANGYLAEETGSAWQSLWTNVKGIRDSWGLVWKMLASRFKESPSVLGFELINEPFAGDIYHSPKILLPFPPSSADLTLFQGAYGNVTKQIREVDSDHLVFFPGMPWDDCGEAFTAPPVGPQEAHRSVIAYHYYSLPDGPQIPGTVGLQMYFHKNEAMRIRTGRMLTETFAPDQDAYFGANNGVADTADKFRQSWAVWEWKTFCRESKFVLNSSRQEQWGEYGACKTGFGKPWDPATNRPFYANEMARTYAFAVGGNITEMIFNGVSRKGILGGGGSGDGTFTLVFAINTTITMPTEIFVSTEYYYENGFDVAIDPAKAFTPLFNETSRVLKLMPVGGASVGMGQEVQVKITRRT